MSVYIGAAAKNDYSAMRGPCPEGFHVPSKDEWKDLCGILTSTFGLASNSTTTGTYLKMPMAGHRNFATSNVDYDGTGGYYWSSTAYSTSEACYLYFRSSSLSSQSQYYRAFGFSMRCFKDAPVTPDSNWTTLYQGTGSAGVFRNSSLGLISVSGDGTTWHTIQDKNLGATVVYNQGDTLSDANCGYFYQWGNNYGFAHSGTITTSSTQVDASNYGPGNYYSSGAFITRGSRPYDWSSVQNDNLWGGVTGAQQTLKELKSAYIGDYERIEYKMNADSNGNLYVPVGGCKHNGSAGASYDWNVSVDGGTSTNYSGTGSDGGSITLSGYAAGSNHTITITPTTEEYGWALAYGWITTAGVTYLTEVVYDGSYMGYGESATSTGNNFRRSQYYGCTSLTTAPAEVLPDTVTSIGNNFRHYQYYNCTSLTAAPAEVLPNSVTSIGSSFRYYQYIGCTSLTTAPAEVLPSSVTTIGTHFRAFQYNGCTSLTTAGTEALPNSVTSIGTYFRARQYYGCASLTEIKGWKDLSIGNNSYYRHNQFYNCTSSKTVTVLSDVGYASYGSGTLSNSYVTTVYVPSAYLSNFTGASVQPRSSIDDSKFIGY